MSDTEALSLAGGIVGGALVAIILGLIIFYVLVVIALWKIFDKAGEAGWKSLIPIYNVYIMCKILGINFWIWALLVPFVAGILDGLIFGTGEDATSVISPIYMLGFDIYMSYKLAKAFGKGTGFTIGLVIFPNIFQLILGFGSAKYVGNNE